VISCLGGAAAAGDENGSPVLGAEDCVRIALERHPILEAAAADLGGAASRVRQAWTGYLPRGSFRQTFTHLDVPVESVVRGVDLNGDGTTTEQSSQRFDFHESTFTARQTVFDFGKTLDQIRSANADRAAAAADVENARADVTVTVRRAFFEAVSAEAQLRAREESLGQEDAVTGESVARQESGLAPQYDVTQAKVRAGLSRLAVIDARRQVALARERLRTAMGVESPVDGRLDPDLSLRPIALRLDEMLAAALSGRPEIRGLEEKVRAEERRAGAIVKDFLPFVAGEASYGFTGRKFPLADGWSLGVGATLPLFDSFETGARLGEERAVLAATRARLKRLRQEIELQVRESFIELDAAASSATESAQVLEVARKNLDLARGRYGEGIGSVLEVSDAHSGRTAAEIASVQALAAHRIARAMLERAIARPLD
jgi:outer membrane protein TolC